MALGSKVIQRGTEASSFPFIAEMVRHLSGIKICEGTKIWNRHKKSYGTAHSKWLSSISQALNNSEQQNTFFFQDFICFILNMPVCNTLHVCGVVVKLQYILNVVQAAQHTSDHQSKKTKIIPETVLDCGSLSLSFKSKKVLWRWEIWNLGTLN